MAPERGSNQRAKRVRPEQEEKARGAEEEDKHMRFKRVKKEGCQSQGGRQCINCLELTDTKSPQNCCRCEESE